MAKNVDDLMSLPYSMMVRFDPLDGIYVARVTELPGCSGHGASAEDAIGMLRDNMAAWFETCLDSGAAIPQPMSLDELPSGKWLQRAPKTLHLALIDLARKEDVSLNQLIVAILSRHVGYETCRVESAPPQPESPRLADPWSKSIGNFTTTIWKLEGASTPQTHIESLDMAFLNHLANKVATLAIPESKDDIHGKKTKHGGWN